MCDDLKLIRKNIRIHYAQKSRIYDRRIFLDHNSSILGENYEVRDEFTRDKDRIIHTKAFRRLQHKAQVYSNEKSDHYRTRLTHTLEVNQIAKAIARNLNVNENLTEAIALGHDIGHTPFGHAGEIVLDKILRGQDDLDNKIKFNLNYGGFKHNFNSLKILELVEKRYENENGLNLTWQTLDGICKHTSIMKNDFELIWDWKRYVNDTYFFEKIIGYSYPEKNRFNQFPIGIPLTIEGQIVKIADEIAQREHDLDDSSSNQDYTIKFHNLKLILNQTEKNINKGMEGYDLFVKLKNELKISEPFSSDDFEVDIIWSNCIRSILSYFIRDITENSIKNISKDNKESIIEVLTQNNNQKYSYFRKYIVKELVKFSEVGKEFNKSIEIFIENKIINSFEVNRFDGKSEYILRKLFKAYYENPKQMPQSQLRILEKMIIENSEKYGNLYIEGKPLHKIKIVTSLSDGELQSKNVSKLISYLKLENPMFSKLLEKECKDLDKIEFLNDKINDSTYFSKIKIYLENHYAYLYVISNYISKMTDNYAQKEFNKLYLGY